MPNLATCPECANQHAPSPGFGPSRSPYAAYQLVCGYTGNEVWFDHFGNFRGEHENINPMFGDGSVDGLPVEDDRSTPWAKYIASLPWHLQCKLPTRWAEGPAANP